MNRFFRPLGAALGLFAALALAGCASPGPGERRATRLQQVESAAGEPVESFRYWQMYSWESLGDHALAIWTRPNEAWLVEVEQPCGDLQWGHTIALTSTMHRVAARFDAVLVEDQRCRIKRIRPVDVKALRSADDAVISQAEPDPAA